MERIIRLKELLATSPHDSFIQHALALEYIKIGNNQEAQSLFEELLGRDENYIGSYYHLGKLLERKNELGKAIEIYEKGLRKAKEAGDMHAYSELLAAYEDLTT